MPAVARGSLGALGFQTLNRVIQDIELFSYARAAFTDTVAPIAGSHLATLRRNTMKNTAVTVLLMAAVLIPVAADG